MISFFLSLILTTSALAADSIPTGCSASPNFSVDAYKVWIAEGVQQETHDEAPLSRPVPVGQRAELQLTPHGTESSGFVNFEIPSAGTYVIATDAYPRMNLTDLATGEILNPVDFGKIRDCGSVSKALRFEFTQPRKILLGFVSSQNPVLNILIWRLTPTPTP